MTQTISTIMRFLLFAVVFLFYTLASGQIGKTDPCLELCRSAENRLRGTEAIHPFFVANGTIVRAEELDKKLIDTIFILKCSDSFNQFQSLAGAGIVKIETSQSFRAVSLEEILPSIETTTANRKVVFALNGILTDDLTLRISKKAIVKMDILLNAVVADKHVSPDLAVVNIWTITRKEKRGLAKLSKLCRGVGVQHQ